MHTGCSSSIVHGCVLSTVFLKEMMTDDDDGYTHDENTANTTIQRDSERDQQESLLAHCPRFFSERR